MGCQSSDIMPFINALGDDDNQNPQKNQQQQQPRQQPQYSQPQQSYQPQQEVANKVDNAAVLPKRKKRPVAPRQKLENKANLNDDFLTHHLKYQLSLSNLVTTKRIQRRQILQHIILQNYWGNVGGQGVNILAYFETAQSSWMQRTFLEIWEVAHDEFFNQHVQEKAVRKKIAEQYMYELYELKEYVDAGLGNLNALIEKTRSSLFEYLQYSDDGLFNLFKKLKDRYPQTGATEKIEFPDVPSTKTKENLFNNFPSKAYVDPPNLNLQTIYDDISLLLKKAIELQDVFKDDMRDLLGQDALACPKVTQVIKDGVPQFNACAVRRVFIKWAENLLEACPDLQCSKPFLKFIKAKSDIANNFFFKSTVQKSTHKIVVDTICYLIEVAKYGLKDQSKRKEFMFNIYDLLRCKVKRNTAEEVVQLFRKLESTKVTKSGTKFELLRVKNRFKTNNRDLLVNFRYGDILVGEAQLCIDNANVSKITKLNYQFCHYIYELERSLFGPTLELMMQYEDYQRPDISVSFEAEDLVDKRGNQMIENSQATQRLCMQGHGMIGLVGNYFIGDDPNQVLPASCNFCDRVTSTDIMYDYCFHCSCYLCRECTEEYKNYKVKESWLSVQREELAVKITDPAQITAECAKNKSLLVLFYIDNSSPSQLFKDSLVYHQGKLLVQPGKYIPKIALANCSVNKSLISAFKLTDFPTFILFDGKGKPVRTLIGYSWLEVPFFYETQRRLISGESIEIQPICAGCPGQNAVLEFKEIEQGQQLFCLNCFNSNTPNIDRIPQNYHGYGGFCPSGHYRCISCCYAALDVPSGYKDPSGVSYLSTKIVNPKLGKCPKGHVPKLTYTSTLPAVEYQCFNCKQNRYFDNQSGVGICEQCKVGICPACMGFPRPSLIQLDQMSDLAIHYVESTAEEGTLCACERHFKKVYKTRMLSLEELISNNQSADSKTWKCFLCQRIGREGDLHIACFGCPSLSQAAGKKTNFEICITCATKTELLMRQPEQKIKEEPSFFVCPSRHKMVYTSIAYDQQLTFNCKFCNKKYFGHTERVHCKTCKFDCCDKCIGQLSNANPPRCSQRCKNQHELRLLYSVNSLKFCDGCMRVIRKEHFDCEPCGYQLCLDCSGKAPGFVGNAFNDFFNSMTAHGHSSKEIDYQEPEEQEEGEYEEEEEENNNQIDFNVFDDFF